MWAVQGSPGFPAWFGLVLLAICIVSLICYIRFDRWVAPRAVILWAAEQGYTILRLDRIYFGRTWFAARREMSHVSRPTNTQVLYRIEARTSEGVASEAWLVVGGPMWACQSASRCPVRVQWRRSWIEDPKPLSTPKPDASPMWDEVIDR